MPTRGLAWIVQPFTFTFCVVAVLVAGPVARLAFLAEAGIEAVEHLRESGRELLRHADGLEGRYGADFFSLRVANS